MQTVTIDTKVKIELEFDGKTFGGVESFREYLKESLDKIADGFNGHGTLLESEKKDLVIRATIGDAKPNTL
jgi:hypothetical protein